jgi:hypothetical protein
MLVQPMTAPLSNPIRLANGTVATINNDEIAPENQPKRHNLLSQVKSPSFNANFSAGYGTAG